MKLYNLKNFKLGWIIGNFDPSIVRTSDFEIGIKRYKKGSYEKLHFHKQAIEITIIIVGKVLMNSKQFSENDIIYIEKGETTDFKVIEDTITAVIKIPSVLADKYLVK